ncbi:SpoIIE family protein phosphatase [Streptomyces sp. NPDC002250]|uniref:SpoIIE family protein phosphatase n=1 Tax=Streptomyces sp. NPDC002250 TaxID=3364641 RepID=UPI0036B5F55F
MTRTIEDALIEQFGPSRYVTGILADLDMRTGRLTWINRGHHLPHSRIARSGLPASAFSG